jgi:hypothetical protein
MVSWLDKQLVDGTVRRLAGFSTFTGRILSIGKYSGMQDIVLLALGVFLVLMLWFVF